FDFFQIDEVVIANEIVQQSHNSGRWTLEGADRSLSANHLRANAALPLRSTANGGQRAMITFIGEAPAISTPPATADGHLNHYGKAFKPGRKVGHATVRCADTATLQSRIAEVQALTD